MYVNDDDDDDDDDDGEYARSMKSLCCIGTGMVAA